MSDYWYKLRDYLRGQSGVNELKFETGLNFGIPIRKTVSLRKLGGSTAGELREIAATMEAEAREYRRKAGALEADAKQLRALAYAMDPDADEGVRR
jgi:hypothetical protein